MNAVVIIIVIIIVMLIIDDGILRMFANISIAI